MQTLVVDFETYYDVPYSLKKMPTLAYIRAPQFLVHGAAIKVDDRPAEWVSRDALPAFFAAVPWAEITVIAHNTNFDITILHEKYGVTPGRRVDTLGLCRALLSHDLDFDLDTIAPLLGLGKKGGDLALTKGVRGLSPELEAKLGAYAIQDAELAYGIYTLLMPELPVESAEWMDLVIEMSTEGSFVFDDAMGRVALIEAIDTRNAAIAATGYTETQLRSRIQFPEILRAAGVEPPTKISANTNNITWAFSKNDPAFVRLREDPGTAVLVEGRIAAASNNTIKRIENLIGIASTMPRTIPVQLNVSGAHTHRLSGGGGINMQNLTRGSALRRGLNLGDDDWVVLVADSSQVELRVNMWFSKQQDVIDFLTPGEYVLGEDHVKWQGNDVYRRSAAKAYRIPADKVSDAQRQLHKVVQLGCLGEGTLILVKSAGIAAPIYKPIESITPDDRVWDGNEWVTHKGLLLQGTKDVIAIDGVWMTSDHEVWLSDHWTTAQFLADHSDSLTQALATGSESLPSLAMNSVPAAALPSSWSLVAAMHRNIALRDATYAQAHPLDVTDVPNEWGDIPQANTTATLTLSRSRSIESAYSTASRHAACDATIPTTPGITTTVLAASTFIQLGAQTAACFYHTWSRLKAGISQLSNLIVSTLTKAINQITSASSHAQLTLGISEPFANSSGKTIASARSLPTFDLAMAGPLNRYTIKTNSGHLLVHNCGFGMGPNKFRATCAIGPMGNPPIYISDNESGETIFTYRSDHPFVKISWDWLGAIAVPTMATKGASLKRGPVTFEYESIALPDGMHLLYPGLEETEDGWQWGLNGMIHRIYGGILQENIVQALAGIAIKQQALAIRHELAGTVRIIHQVHDELICKVRRRDAVEAMRAVVEIMSRPLPWADGLPLRCNAGFASNYSK